MELSNYAVEYIDRMDSEAMFRQSSIRSIIDNIPKPLDGLQLTPMTTTRSSIAIFNATEGYEMVIAARESVDIAAARLNGSIFETQQLLDKLLNLKGK